MGTENIGGQEITFDFGQAVSSQKFNKIHYKIIKPGIYDGGSLIKIDNSTVRISPITVYFEDPNNEIGIRVQTTEIIDITVTPSTPYIIFRFSWQNAENNYMDVLAITYSEIESSDIINGRVIFIDGVIQDKFDYTRRTKGNLNESVIEQLSETENVTDPFFVQANEPASNNVIITEGQVVTSFGQTIFHEEQDSPTFSDTVDGRIDLLYINSDGQFAILEGIDSPSPTIPQFTGNEGSYVLAKITRGANATVITGDQIQNYGLKIIRMNNINADSVNGYEQGYNSDDIPVIDGLLNTNLNAEMLDGAILSTNGSFANLDHNTIPSQKASKTYIDNNLTMPVKDLVNFFEGTAPFVFMDNYADYPDTLGNDFSMSGMQHSGNCVATIKSNDDLVVYEWEPQAQDYVESNAIIDTSFSSTFYFKHFRLCNNGTRLVLFWITGPSSGVYTTVHIKVCDRTSIGTWETSVTGTTVDSIGGGTDFEFSYLNLNTNLDGTKIIISLLDTGDTLTTINIYKENSGSWSIEHTFTEDSVEIRNVFLNPQGIEAITLSETEMTFYEYEVSTGWGASGQVITHPDSFSSFSGYTSPPMLWEYYDLTWAQEGRFLIFSWRDVSLPGHTEAITIPVVYEKTGTGTSAWELKQILTPISPSSNFDPYTYGSYDYLAEICRTTISVHDPIVSISYPVYRVSPGSVQTTTQLFVFDEELDYYVPITSSGSGFLNFGHTILQCKESDNEYKLMYYNASIRSYSRPFYNIKNIT